MYNNHILKAAEEESKRIGVSPNVIVGMALDEAGFHTIYMSKRELRRRVRLVKKACRSTRKKGTVIGTAWKSILTRIQAK